MTTKERNGILGLRNQSLQFLQVGWLFHDNAFLVLEFLQSVMVRVQYLVQVQRSLEPNVRYFLEVHANQLKRYFLIAQLVQSVQHLGLGFQDAWNAWNSFQSKRANLWNNALSLGFRPANHYPGFHNANSSRSVLDFGLGFPDYNPGFHNALDSRQRLPFPVRFPQSNALRERLSGFQLAAHEQVVLAQLLSGSLLFRKIQQIALELVQFIVELGCFSRLLFARPRIAFSSRTTFLETIRLRFAMINSF